MTSYAAPPPSRVGCLPEHPLRASFFERFENRGFDAWVKEHREDGADFLLATIEACGQYGWGLHAREALPKLNSDAVWLAADRRLQQVDAGISRIDLLLVVMELKKEQEDAALAKRLAEARDEQERWVIASHALTSGGPRVVASAEQVLSRPDAGADRQVLEALIEVIKDPSTCVLASGGAFADGISCAYFCPKAPPQQPTWNIIQDCEPRLTPKELAQESTQLHPVWSQLWRFFTSLHVKPLELAGLFVASLTAIVLGVLKVRRRADRPRGRV